MEQSSLLTGMEEMSIGCAKHRPESVLVGARSGAGALAAQAVDGLEFREVDVEQLDKPLAFVNRYSETLDVLMPNLVNQEALRCNQRIKFAAALAAQPPGTGKTALGENITAVLRRPRETDALAAAAVAERLRTAWCWHGVAAAAVEQALQDPRDENLVMRTLMAAYPSHVDTLLKLKHVKPLVIEMKGIVTPDFGFGFDKALAYAIYCAAKGVDGSDPDVTTVFTTQPPALQMAVGAVKGLMRGNGGAPVVLVLDDITDLAGSEFVDYFKPEGKATPLHCAMSQLSRSLQRLHAIPRCFVFCTGRLLWLSLRALIGSGSPLIVQPTLLQPLSAVDIVQTLALTKEPGKPPLRDTVGISPDLMECFASRVQALTGGVSRALQYLLRERQREHAGGAPVLRSRSEIDAALERLMPRLAKIPGMLLRISWDGPTEAAAAGEVPTWAEREVEQARLLQLFARMLLLEAPFDPDFAIEVGGERLRLSDAAVVLGLTYGPSPSPLELVEAAASPSKSRTHLLLIAGTWLCRSLLNEPSVTNCKAVLASVQLLATMRSFGGTMRGRPFEMLCADTLCWRSLVRPGTPLGELLPHLGRSLRGRDVVPALRVVALPKAVNDGRLPFLDDRAKAQLLQSREQWTGPANVHARDLPWILSEWLPVNTLGVPADAQSGSQDMFLRLSGGIVGLALKAVGDSNGTDWSDLRSELDKAPALPAHLPYTLVLWSLNLAPQLRTVLGEASSAVYGQGRWEYRKGALVVLADDEKQNPDFKVGAAQELAIANPHAATGGGLGELLGSSVFGALQSMSGSTGHLAIAHLTQWMAQATVRHNAAQ